MITAPETAHNVKYAIDEALRCKKAGQKKVIVSIIVGMARLIFKHMMHLSTADSWITNQHT